MSKNRINENKEMIKHVTDIEELPSNLLKELMNTITLAKISQTKEGFFKNSTFFDPVDKAIENETHLFRSVLDRALVDYLLPVDKETCSKEMLFIKADVEEWLDKDNEEFLTVCELALLDPEMVYTCFHIVDQILKKKEKET